jgi:hypothetical protein
MAFAHGDATSAEHEGEAEPDNGHLRVPAAQAQQLEVVAEEALTALATREVAAVADWIKAMQAGESPRSSLALPGLVEFPFEIPLVDIGVLFRGIIDRLDVVQSAVVTDPPNPATAPIAPLPELLIREFKSGAQWRSSGGITKRPQDSQQMGLYAFALQRLFHQSGALSTPLFTSDLQMLSLESIETGQAITFAVDKRAATNMSGTIAAVAARIKAGDFAATPSESKCSFCAYQMICPHAHGVFSAVMDEAAKPGKVTMWSKQ